MKKQIKINGFPTIQEYIQSKLDYLIPELEQKESELKRNINNHSHDKQYKDKIKNFQHNVDVIRTELNELFRAVDKLNGNENSFPEDCFVATKSEIQSFENTENDKLYTGIGKIYEEEDLNDC